MIFDMTEKFEVENTNHKQWNAICPNENAQRENFNLIIFSQIIETASCQETGCKNIELIFMSIKNSKNC